MSMCVHLFPVVLEDEVWKGTERLETDSWAQLLKDITDNAIQIEHAVNVPWVKENELRLKPQAFDYNAVDEDCTWLIPAWVAKFLTLYSPDWHPERIARQKLIEERLKLLPDDSFLIAYYV